MRSRVAWGARRRLRTRSSPAAAAATVDAADVPVGSGERFAGYGIMGLPFASGHVLAMRRFPASSIGPGYTSVWHRDPEGAWTFVQDRPDGDGCARYFSASLDRTEEADIEVRWTSHSTLEITIAAVALEWQTGLTATPATRMLNRAGRAIPDPMWRSPALVGVMGPLAAGVLRVGRIGLVGSVPNGHRFVANPRLVWMVADSSARLAGTDLGPPGPLVEQASLGDFWIPQRGVFAVGRAFFDPPTDLVSTRPRRHLVEEAR